MEIDVVGAGGGPQPSLAFCPQVRVDGGEGVESELEKASNAGVERLNNLPEDEDDVCRICRTQGDDESPLYYPCACSGSIKYVHQDCLLQWLNHSNARQCEVCKHAFAFSPVYAENAPSRLPFQELLLGMALKAARGLRFIIRLMFVLSVWLLFVPFTTFWIWRFTFVRSFSEAYKLFISRCTPGLLLTDCLHGFLLSAGIVFIFLGATSLREYFRHLRELGGQEGDRAEEGVDRGRAGGHIVRELHGAVGRGAAADFQEPVLQPGGVVGDVGPGQGLAAGAGQLIRRNAENVAARLELQAARLEAHVEQMFDAVEDPDGAEDVPFDELVGMQGPVFHLVENAITVLASNAIFLALVALVPFTLGRVVLSVASRLVFVTIAASGMMPLNITTSSVGNIPLGNMSVMLAGRNIFFEDATNTAASGSAFGGVASGYSGNVVRNVVTEAMAAALQVSDAATVAVGYGVIFLALSFYLGLIALIRYSRGEPITVGRIHGVATMAEAAPSLAKQVIAGVKYMATMVKVACLLIIELGVFPLMCGWWLDICTLGMLDVSITRRVEFFWASPLTSSLLHWLVGIVYMLQISIFVSLLREVLRPGVLYFLRDPTDPNYNPFRDLIDDPIYKHARRVLLSVVVYGSLIVMLVFLPVQLAIITVPSLFPLDIRVSDPFTEIPADMLLFHICIPFAVEHFRPRATIKIGLLHWFSAVGWALGLSEFLLPGLDEASINNDEQDTGRRVQEGQAQVPDRNHAHAALDEQREGEVLPVNMFREDSSEYLEGGQESGEEYKFVLRIVMLLIGAWITLLAVNSAMVLVPVTLGRGIFSLFSKLPIARGAKCNDLYAFNIGCYILWATAAAARYMIDYLKTHDFGVLLVQVLKWFAIVAKSVVLLALWIVVIPIVVGLLFELLVVVPLRVPVDESPVFIFYQDWALGLVFLKIWTRLVMLGQITPLADESWRLRFEQVRADGFANLRGCWVMKEIIAPILIRLLMALCVPYVLARWIFPSFGYPLIVNSAVNRFAWLGCLGIALIWYGVKRLRQWLLDLHNSIRDDRYLVGRRLHNFGERKRIGSPAISKRESFPVTGRFSGSVLEEVSRLGCSTSQDSASNQTMHTSAGSSSTGVLEEKSKFTQADSRDVLLRAAIQEGERIGMAGASLRFRHSTATSSSNTDQ